MTDLNLIFKRSIFTVALLFPSLSFSHENHHHHAPKADPSSEVQKARELALKEIGESYKKSAMSTFEKNCMDCHSDKTRYPWYSKLPFAKGLIESDIREAKEHLDMTDGFPFKGHGSPEEDLKAIRKSIEEGSMPPFRYRALHWGSALTKEEKEAVFLWIRQSEEQLQKVK